MPALDDPRLDPSVWVVEDDEEVLRLLIEVFEGSGLAVRAFSHPIPALEALREGRPDVLVLDWHLPRMTGWLFLEQLRAIGRSALPVIIITGDVRLDPRQGVAAIFRKPVRLDALVAKIVELGQAGRLAQRALA
jgi:two-component system phosphate regulon response regulator PhoB